MCSYPGESEYQVVFAYAYLAGGGRNPGLAGLWLAFRSGAHAAEILNISPAYVNLVTLRHASAATMRRPCVLMNVVDMQEKHP